MAGSSSTSSTPDGSWFAAVRSRRRLSESDLREPLMPRTRIELGLDLRQLELDGELDVVGQREPALGERRVPVEAVLRAVDDGLERDADLLDVAERDRRVGDGAAALDLLAVALDGQRAVGDELVALAADVVGDVADLRVLLGVEEVRRLEVAGQVLVLDDDRVGLDGAGQLGGAALVDGQRGVEVLEAATEG